MSAKLIQRQNGIYNIAVTTSPKTQRTASMVCDVKSINATDAPMHLREIVALTFGTITGLATGASLGVLFWHLV